MIKGKSVSKAKSREAQRGRVLELMAPIPHPSLTAFSGLRIFVVLLTKELDLFPNPWILVIVRLSLANTMQWNWPCASSILGPQEVCLSHTCSCGTSSGSAARDERRGIELWNAVILTEEILHQPISSDHQTYGLAKPRGTYRAQPASLIHRLLS